MNPTRSPLHALGASGPASSAAGLATIEYGRDPAPKYPAPHPLPDKRHVRESPALARGYGIDRQDSVPVHSANEPTRTGGWPIATQIGEKCCGGKSHCTVTARHPQAGREPSPRLLRRDGRDIVAIHRDGNEETILCATDVPANRHRVRGKGLVRAIDLSSNAPTAHGDAAMRRRTLDDPRNTPTIRAAYRVDVGILVAKSFASDHRPARHGSGESSDFPFAEPLTTRVPGTTDPHPHGGNRQAVAAAAHAHPL